MAGKKPDNTPTPPDSQPTILGGRFDPRRMIRDQSFAGSGGTYDGLLKVTLGKPNPALLFRSHIKPGPGYGLCYMDYRAQEYLIAAALSGDGVMMQDYAGDPYIAWAIHANACPPGSTKASHPEIRKIASLATLMGQTAFGLSMGLGIPLAEARGMLAAHQDRYRDFWRWSRAVVAHATARGEIHTAFGWRMKVKRDDNNPRAIMNYPLQSNGSEMIRLACGLGIERGVEICCSVHDAVLIAAPIEQLDDRIHAMDATMREAAAIVLQGAQIDVEWMPVKYPDRYPPQDDAGMWDRIMGILDQLERA